MAGFGSRVMSSLKHAWNVFRDEDTSRRVSARGTGGGMYYRPERTRISFSNERSIVAAIYTRLSIDLASIAIKHVRLDENDRYFEDIKSGLNDCLTIEANLDQGAQAFRQDVFLSLFEKGFMSIVPVDTTINPMLSGSYDIQSMRVGDILAWNPDTVQLSVYNEKTGLREQISMDKKAIAIVENPLYSVMNETNSMLQRLIRKLNLLDVVDEQASSGKLDIIIQLPYVIKSEARKQQAEQRRLAVEQQLKDSKYGIAYIDGTEKVTQLNRPAENNLLATIEYLTKMVYGQLGVTEAVMNGTADEPTMLNYMQRTLKPIMNAVVESMTRSFLTKTARTQRQSIMYFPDRMAFVPIGGVGGIADIADKLVRAKVSTPNDMRQVIGWKPSSDPEADKLANPQMPADKAAGSQAPIKTTATVGKPVPAVQGSVGAKTTKPTS